MILVTVGAQMPFDRLVSAVDRWAELSGRSDVFAQIGETELRPPHIEWTKFVNPDEFRKLVESAEAIVAHAGMGSILTALELGKPIIVMPRRGALQETRNDHQVATARQLSSQGLVTVAWDERDLVEKLDSELGHLSVSDRIPRHASVALSATLADFVNRPRSGIVDGVICFGGVDWWYHNRGHYDIQMMREFSRRMPVLYVNSIGMRTPSIGEGSIFFKRVARKLRSWSRGLELARENFGVLSPISIPKFHKTKLARSFLVDQVRDAAAWMKIRHPLIWIACPPAAEVIDQVPAVAGLLYQRTDRFEHYPGVDSQKIRTYDLKLKEESDLTLFCSTSVYEDEKSDCRMAAFVDHGVDYEAFVAADQDPTGEPEDVKSIPRPRLGFIGGIDAHTFDPSLFYQVAAAMPDCAFVMVGACSLPEGWCSLENVHFLGRKPYRQVAAYMAACDVLIMPWTQNAWIKACNPVKLKEYMAVGRPIVSTPFDELNRYKGLVGVATNAVDFTQCIRQALENGVDKNRLRSHVEKETWQAKADAVIENLREAGVSFRGAPRVKTSPSMAQDEERASSGDNGISARSRHSHVKQLLGIVQPSEEHCYWRKRHLLLAGFLAFLGVLVTADAWRDVFGWAMRDEESSHIWLVLPVAAWLAWVRREDASAVRRTGNLIGPLFMAIGWLFYTVGDIQLIQSFWYLGALLVVVGAALSILGRQILLRFWPAFLVLLLLIPVPGMVRHQFTSPLQTITAGLTAVVLETVGTPVEVTGNVLNINGVPVGIAEACNGMRMILALALVCYLYAFMTELSGLARFLILLSSPLVAIAANVVRLVPTVWLYGYGDPQVAEAFHTVSGWAMMPLALAAFMGAGALYRWATAPTASAHQPLPKEVPAGV